MNRSSAWCWALFFLIIPDRFGVLRAAPLDKHAAIEVPFEFVHGAIVVQVTVKGRGPFWMMLDTGADPSIVDMGTAKSLGLKIAERGQQGSGGGTGANLAHKTSLPAVRLGGLTAKKVEALAMDLSSVSTAMGRPIGGVLGYSLLKARIVQIDYPKNKVRFYESRPACAALVGTPASQCTTLSFRYQDDILASGVTVNGKAVTANVDTGSNSKFQLAPAAVDRLGLGEELARAHESGSVGFNGQLKNREGTVGNVTVGAISVDKPAMVFYGKGMGMDEEPWDLRIGNGFLKDFVVTFDFRQGRIMLAAR